ncbi:efflux pump antibiotic resistance protein [Apiospora saccharicola]|uniref:Efflux pump antibiotic resistance protein n=1 Tax=Apiospora saccharicola TaxID=335842 RepID=A0ABR1WL60_9PEZI
MAQSILMNKLRDSDPAEIESLGHGVEPATLPIDNEKVDAKKVDLREDGTEYSNGVKLYLIMHDSNAIIAMAIPKITDEFHSLPDVGWYGSAAIRQALHPFQRQMGLLGTIIVFELGSLICGVAQNSVTLIIGRAVAELGSAGLMSGSLLILAHSVPLAKRPVYSGMIGGPYGVASVAGPLLGGVLTDNACFLINLPIGAVTVFAIAFFYADPQIARPSAESFMERLKRSDPWGGTEYLWNDNRIIALFVVFGILVIAFISVQLWQSENATVPPRIMRNRSVWSSLLFGFFIAAAFFVMVYHLPIWFQAVQGALAVESGVRIAVTVFGYYTPFMIAATVLMSIGAGLLSTFEPGTSRAAWIGYQQPLMAVQAVLNMADVPTGTSIIVFAQTLGGSPFVSVGQSVFTNQLVKSLAADVPSLSPLIVLAADIAGVQLAYSEALTKAYVVTIALSAFSVIGCVFCPWKSVKGKKFEAGLV